jgi:hypothetical protein
LHNVFSLQRDFSTESLRNENETKRTEREESSKQHFSGLLMLEPSASLKGRL